MFGQNVRHTLINNDLTFSDLESSSNYAITEKLYDRYIGSIKTENFIDANAIRDIILRNEIYYDCFLTEEQSNFFIFLCTS